MLCALPPRENRLRQCMTGLTHVYLCLMATVHLLCFGASGLRAITAAKWVSFLCLTGGYTAVMLVLLGVGLARGTLRLSRPQPASVLTLCYLGLTVAAGLQSPWFSQTWLGASRHEGVVTIVLYGLSSCLVAGFARPRQWMSYVLGAGVTALCAVGALQLAGANPGGLFPQGLNYYNTRRQYLTTIGNVGFVASFLCVAIPAMLVTVLRGRGSVRLWLLLPLGAAIWLAARIQVLAGFVGLGAGLALAAGPVLLRTRRARRIYAGALVLAAVAATVAIWRFDVGEGLLHELHELLCGRVSDRFGSGRIFIWRQVLRRIGQRPLFGYGPDTMKLAGLTPFTRYDAASGRQIVAAIDAAHCEYLNICYHQGVPALAVYLGMLAVCAFDWARAARGNACAAVFGTACLCYAIAAAFGISQPVTAPYFWLSLGLLRAALAHPQSGKPAAPENV